MDDLIPNKTIINPPAEVEKILREPGGIIEILSKLVGRPPNEGFPNIKIYTEAAKQVPRHIIRAALMSTDDKFQQNKDPNAKYTKDLEAYFLAALRGKCRDAKLEVNF